jgi:hypothetical protein
MKKDWPPSRPGWQQLHTRDLPEIAAEYESGTSCRKIGMCHGGLTRSAVKKFLKKNGVKLRSHGGDRRSAAFRMASA